MYLTESGDIKVTCSNIPVMGFIDMPNVSENNILNCQYEIKNILVKPNPAEQHSVYIEIEFEVCCDATDTVEIESIQDMYCPNAELQFKQKQVNTITKKKINKNVCNIRERIVIPEISSNRIYDVEIMPDITNVNVLNGRIVYEGELKLNFIFSSNNNSGIDTKRYSLPFTHNVDDEFIITSYGMVDCKVNLEFETKMHEDANINLIDEINMTEDTNNSNPSMVIYIVKEGDTIWEIAKKYKTTMQEIININNLDNGDEIFVGEKLFIPRFYMNRIA